MLKMLLGFSVFISLSVSLAQMPLKRAIQCQGSRSALNVELLNGCQMVNNRFLCKSRIVIDKIKSFETGLYVLLRQLPQSPNVNLSLVADDREKTKVEFSGFYERKFFGKGSFLGEVRIKVQNFELKESMTCTML